MGLCCGRQQTEARSHNITSTSKFSNQCERWQFYFTSLPSRFSCCCCCTFKSLARRGITPHRSLPSSSQLRVQRHPRWSLRQDFRAHQLPVKTETTSTTHHSPHSLFHVIQSDEARTHTTLLRTTASPSTTRVPIMDVNQVLTGTLSPGMCVPVQPENKQLLHA